MKIRLSQLRRIIRESIVEAKRKSTRPPPPPKPDEVIAVWVSPSGGSAYLQTVSGGFYLHGSGNALMFTEEQQPPPGWHQLSNAALSYVGIYPQLSVGGKPWNPELGPPSPEFIMANSYNDRHDQPAPQAFDSPTVGRRRV